MNVLPLFALFATATAFAATAPRVVVWNPERSARTPRFSLDAAYHDRIAADLAADGVDVLRATTAEIAAGALDSVPDALLLEGGTIPESIIEPCKRFADAGGVLVCLAARNGFEIKIAQNDAGDWRLSPESPNFAWQTTAIHSHFGMEFRWQNDMLNSGTRHTPTDLLRRYLPDIPDADVLRPLPSRWFLPKDGTFHPLVRSRMLSGDDFTPQVYIVRKRRRAAIFCASGFWTNGEGTDSAAWPYGRALVAALCAIARDLHSGTLDLDATPTVEPVTEIVQQPPLAFRPLADGIDPECIRPLVRWGAFNGSRAEFGKTSLPNAVMDAPANAPSETLPGGLASGAMLHLHAPADVASGDAARLRIRFAVAKPGVALRVALGDTVVWNEAIVARNLDSTVNLGHNYVGTPLELTRLVTLPGDLLTAAGGVISVANSGDDILHLDALQLERRDPATERRIELGLHTSTSLAYGGKHALTPERCHDWSVLRCTTRTWWIGAPDDPKRWDRFDKHVERYLALHPRCQFIFEGTPEWAAESPERYTAGGNRKQTTPPDNAKFAELAERIVTKYGDRVQDWEIWNEANINYFWSGKSDEFAAFHKSVAPVVRRLDPEARIIVAGMAGVEKSSVDGFATAMSKAGALTPDMADLYGMHCYSPEGMWDAPYGLIEGHLMALGEPIEIYPNEQGYDMQGGKLSAEKQGEFFNRGLARLFAAGATKITCFQSDGKADFGVLNEKGEPRPAYLAFEDYLSLVPGRRLDVSLASPDGAPLRGVYAMASQRDDGTIALVLNPADVEEGRANAAVKVRIPLPSSGDWKAGARDGESVPLAVNGTAKAPYAEVGVNLGKRTVLSLSK